jgi:hypothetical protein
MLWMWLIVAIVLLAVIVVGLLRLGAQPIRYRGLLLTDLARFLDGFLQQLDAGSVFLLERESGPGFLQLAILRRQRVHETLELGVPDAMWSRERFDLVHNAMQAGGYDCSVETNPDNMAIPRFLRVRVEGNRHELVPILIRILELAAGQLQFDAGDRYTLRMSGPLSSEYEKELATQLDQLGKSDRIAQAGAAWLRRLAKKQSRG